MVKVLAAWGADLDATDAEGRTPADPAERGGYPDVADFLRGEVARREGWAWSGAAPSSRAGGGL